jgi:SEC-C motif-containing protein
MTHDTTGDGTVIHDGQGCPCGRGLTYGRCCGRLHRGDAEALTAEDLMRARYSAFAVGATGYLDRSWHPSSRPGTVRVVPGQRWTGLDVIATEAGGPLDSHGVVEFVAHHERDGQPGSLHERSTFARLDGRWVYVSGEV